MSTERWVYLHDNGQIILHEENDGWTFMRRGAEATEREITLDELKNYSPHYENGLKLIIS
jgi:hypothetical protein